MSDINQIALAVFGFAAIALTQLPRLDNYRIRRWAPVLGLASQPFWLIETWAAGQAGMFLLSVAYTATWAYGLWMYWRR